MTSPADLERAVMLGRCMLPYREVFLDGEVYRRAGATDKAVACYEMACVSPDPAEWIPASRRLADVKSAKGQWEDAESIVLHCRSAAQQHGLVLEEALAANSLAAIRWAQGDLAAAQHWFERAAASTEPTARGFALMNLGIIAAQQKHYPLAASRFTAAHVALTVADDFEAIANLDLNRASMAVNSDRAEEALAIIVPAMDFASRVNADLYARMQLVYAEALANLGRFEEAEVAIGTAAGHFTHARTPTQHVRVLLALACLAERSGDRIEAISRYSRAHEVAESLGMEDDMIEAGAHRDALLRGAQMRPTLLSHLA